MHLNTACEKENVHLPGLGHVGGLYLSRLYGVLYGWCMGERWVCVCVCTYESMWIVCETIWVYLGGVCI